MHCDSAKYHRRSIRLKGYDYSRTGVYFVTLCTDQRRYLLSTIDQHEVTLTEFGGVLDQKWQELAQYGSGVTVDEYVLMPDHLHGLIVLQNPPTADPHTKLSLSDLMQRYKSLTTTLYRRYEQENGLAVSRRLWQRNYYERIVRDDTHLDTIRRYIQTNPIRWKGK